MGELFGSEEAVDIKRLGKIILSNLPAVAAVTVAAGLLFFVYSSWFIAPVYSSNVKFYVNNQQGISSSIKVQNADVTTSSTLVHGYVAMIKTDRVLEEVAANTNLGYSAGQLGSMIEASGVENTPIFVVVVKNTNPAHAQALANAIADIAPPVIQEVVKGSSVEIIDRAKLPVRPVSPDVKKLTLIGLGIGFVIGVAFVLIKENVDLRVKNGEELTKRFGLPVLSVIPRINAPSDIAK